MNFFAAHPGFTVGAWVAFAIIVDSMPPLPPDASWWMVWLHNGLQAAAVNFSRIQRNPSRPAGPAIHP